MLFWNFAFIFWSLIVIICFVLSHDMHIFCFVYDALGILLTSRDKSMLINNMGRVVFSRLWFSDVLLPFFSTFVTPEWICPFLLKILNIILWVFWICLIQLKKTNLFSFCILWSVLIKSIYLFENTFTANFNTNLILDTWNGYFKTFHCIIFFYMTKKLYLIFLLWNVSWEKIKLVLKYAISIHCKILNL